MTPSNSFLPACPTRRFCLLSSHAWEALHVLLKRRAARVFLSPRPLAATALPLFFLFVRSFNRPFTNYPLPYHRLLLCSPGHRRASANNHWVLCPQSQTEKLLSGRPCWHLGLHNISKVSSSRFPTRATCTRDVSVPSRLRFVDSPLAECSHWRATASTRSSFPRWPLLFLQRLVEISWLTHIRIDSHTLLQNNALRPH